MTRADPNTAAVHTGDEELGSVFVSNYPPYSFWSEDQVPEARRALGAPPAEGATLGLYLHIPFCRLRCKFCYFKVYTDKDSSDVGRYLKALAAEVRHYSEKPAVQGRPLKFVYVGGGTPSFISSDQLRSLAAELRSAIPWDGVQEISFECEPGTLTRKKVGTIREIGVTRLSLGVEHFDDDILKENGRAHLSPEIYRCLPWVREQGFDQLNIDLIAGMIGETWDTWKDAVRRAIDLDADSVTIYQMELPFNTVYSRKVLEGNLGRPIADWTLKREWHDYAIREFEASGYAAGSAYTMVKKGHGGSFVYRDAVWHGTDMIGAGVASFGHMSGVHIQNASEWSDYLERIESGDLPLGRAFRTDADERLTREMILQMKLGRLDAGYFRGKFGVEILERFSSEFDKLQSAGMLQTENDLITLTRDGLLQVDRLLSGFFAPGYRDARYT